MTLMRNCMGCGWQESVSIVEENLKSNKSDFCSFKCADEVS